MSWNYVRYSSHFLARSPDVCVLPVITEVSFRIPHAPHEILSMRLFSSICERLCNHRPFLASSSTSRDRFLLVFSLLGSAVDTCTASTDRAKHVAVSASGRDSSTNFPVCPQREFHPSCLATETGASAFGRCDRVSSSTDRDGHSCLAIETGPILAQMRLALWSHVARSVPFSTRLVVFFRELSGQAELARIW